MPVSPLFAKQVAEREREQLLSDLECYVDSRLQRYFSTTHTINIDIDSRKFQPRTSPIDPRDVVAELIRRYDAAGWLVTEKPSVHDDDVHLVFTVKGGALDASERDAID